MTAQETSSSDGPEAGDNPRRTLVFGGIIAGLFFIGLLGSAATLPLDAAARAEGVLSVKGSRKAAQTRDGGLVTEILANEGDMVSAGQILVRIAATDVRAAERSMASEYMMLLAQRARLDAERGGLTIVPPPSEMTGAAAEDVQLASDAMTLQQRQLDARRASQATRHNILLQRIRQLSDQSTGSERRLAANRRQQSLIAEELEGSRMLAAKGFAPKTRLLALERNIAELDGQYGALQADIARTAEAIGETRLEIAALSSDRDEEVAQLLRDTQARIDELAPRLAAARDQIGREAVRAPVSGRVVASSIFTVGGVAQPGQTLMEIVPEKAELIVTARLSPDDADDIGYGQHAELRFTGLHERDLPTLTGRVVRLSADRLVDERSGKAFFQLDIAIDPAAIAHLRRLRRMQDGIQVGLPVEIIVPLRSRTALGYLLEPLATFLRTMGHEH